MIIITPFSFIGLSDHGLENNAAIASVMLGASIIEKHITLKRSGGGLDARFSLEPDEMKNMIRIIRSGAISNPEALQKALGKVHYGPATELEEYNKRYRRSLFVVKNIKKEKCLPGTISILFGQLSVCLLIILIK